MPFQGFALCGRVCRRISREQALGYSPPPLSAPACWQAEKPQITKSPPLAVKKVRLRRYKKWLPYFLSTALNRWYNTSYCFFTANGGLFERPKAAFWTMPAVVVMQRMALGMVVTIRRKTRFPTGVTATPKKAKPTTSAMAFCICINLLQKNQIMD